MPSASSSRVSSSAAGVDVVLALLALLVDQALDLLVLARVQRGEGEVLELPLDRVDAEAVRDRRVDLQGLLGLVDLLLLGHRADRAHVVQAIGELDEDDPDVRGHRDHHLAVVLGLRLVAAGEGDAGELGDAVDERGDLVAEALADLVERRARVLDGVVQQRRAQRLGVQAHARADLRHADRVHDEVLARLAPLVGVVLAGEDEGVLDALAVDLDGRVVGVLLDDREQVAEQPALGLGELGAQRPARAPRGARRGRPAARSAGAGPPLRGAAGTAAGGGSVRGSRAMSSRVPLRQRVLRPFGGGTSCLSRRPAALRGANSLIEGKEPAVVGA